MHQTNNQVRLVMESTERESREINLNVIAAKLSHKQSKALHRKEKRKKKRQHEAKLREEKFQAEAETIKNSQSYLAKLAQEDFEAEAEILRINAESQHQRELWQWREQLYLEEIRKKNEQEEKERLLKIEIEKKIKEEWEERQKKEQLEEEEKRKKREKQAKLLQQAREAENKNADWSNPLAPVQYERHHETCPFFSKVAACRFGDRCSRVHNYPESSTTLLLASLFSHFRLDQGLCEEFDTDIVLEYEDSEVYLNFKEFYDDVLPEFKAVGTVAQFKVCCNYEPHLRGNVYVQYERDEDALAAFGKFNGRWYGGKQLSCQFVTVPSWKAAICGLFGRGRCPKGKECNFLHVFKNPYNEYWAADKDEKTDRRSHRHRDGNYSQRSHRNGRSRSRSRERSRSYRSRRSRSRDIDRHDRSRSKYSPPSDRHRHSRRPSRKSRSRSRSKSKDRFGRNRLKSNRSRPRSSSPDKDSVRNAESKTKSKGERSRSSSSESAYRNRDRKSPRKSTDRTPQPKKRSSRSRSFTRSRSRSRERSRHRTHKKKH